MSKKILLVDDEQDLLDILEESLPEFFIEKAKNGKEALEKVKTFQPDLILSDINMPVMNGIEMLEKLRKEGCQTPIIMITAFGDTKNIRLAWKLNAFDFVNKPFNMETLRSTIRNLFVFGASNMQRPMEEKHSSTISTEKVSLELPKALWEEIKATASSQKEEPAIFLTNLIERELKTKKKAA